MARRVLPAWLCQLVLAAIALGASWPHRVEAADAAVVKLEQIISREDPRFDCASADMTIGRDGMVYLSSAGHDGGYILRMGRDGRDKSGGEAPAEAITNATAISDGRIATAHGHFAHLVALLDNQFHKVAGVDDFLVSDQVGWDAAAGVEASTGEDVFGLDQHRDRILRIGPTGKVLRAYALPHRDRDSAAGFRVCEKKQLFYVLFRDGQLRCVGFDGDVKWSRAIGAGVSPSYEDAGGFDVDDDGRIYAIGPREDTLRIFGADGAPSGQAAERLADSVKLALSAGQATDHPIRSLRVWGSEAFVKSRHASEAFRVYDLSTGVFKRAVSIDHQRLTVMLGAGPWVAGRNVDYKLEFDAGARADKPLWKVWARPMHSLDYRELHVAGDQLEVPADFAGVYQLKITPEATPWQRGATASEYKVATFVEVLAPGSVGTVAVATKDNRTHFGRGEAISFSILLHSDKADKTVGARKAVVTLTDGHTVFATAQTEIGADASSESKLELPTWMTARLRPGQYSLNVVAEGMTCVAQPLTIGVGHAASSFNIIDYGDYRATYPVANPVDAPDVVAADVERKRKLGFNMFVDRMGHPQAMDAVVGKAERAQLDEALKSVTTHAPSIPPQKLTRLPAAVDAITAYGADGASQMAILMGNDAGLPLGGPGFDSRKPDELVRDLTTITQALKDYPAMRGWSWSSNWWVFDDLANAGATTALEKSDYDAAKKRALETGVWEAALDRAAGRRLDYAVSAQALFNKKLKELAPGEVTAVACPFRNVASYPPVSMSNVDQCDLQAQWEQISVPLHGLMNVDFYKRPGAAALAHPEIWNDSGSGEQILPVLWQMVMRGSDSIGCSSPAPPWQFALKGNTEDPRSSWNGMPSVYRALNGVLRQYGPWLASLERHDSVAIVASGRMYKIDEWAGTMGRHFARVMEAYIACLYAHRPATIVFAEDVRRPNTFRKYQAVLVVDQRVEMEPELTKALTAAQKWGVKVFADGTCRPNLVNDFTPLGVSFNRLEQDPSPAADDHAYWRLAEYGKTDAAVLNKALGNAGPDAETNNPEVFLTERRAEQGRYLFVVNNMLPRLTPGMLWRVTLATASLDPQVTPVKLNGTDKQTVYDVFAGAEATIEPDGSVMADCRDTVARIYAILPAPIYQVRVTGPGEVAGGDMLDWHATVEDRQWKPIAAAIPIRVQLLDHAGKLIEERFLSCDSHGVSGQFMVPYDPLGRPLLVVTELLSGKATALPVLINQRAFTPIDLTKTNAASTNAPAIESSAFSGLPSGDFAPVENSFGPHVRDMIITANDELAILNTMNWDHNLYGYDLVAGTIRWRQKVGDYFAFDPIALTSGVAVQGFDLRSAEGYYLYTLDFEGKKQRRFALYGLPQRLPHRFVPALIRDHIDSFAAAPNGAWVATAGDLGMAVWAGDGQLLWQQDWFKHDRHPGKVVALDAQSLLVVEGTTATAYRAADGQMIWQTSLGRSGEIRVARVSADRKTCALLNIADGGRLLIIRDGHIVREIPTAAEDVGISADGAHVAVVDENQLKLYSVADGLQWIMHGDDLLHFPRFSTDGRLVASSSLGTVYVTDLMGRKLLERDLGSLAVPCWLASGEMVLATWEGTVCRLNKEYRLIWQIHLTAGPADVRRAALADDGTPISRITGWENADSTPVDLSKNLLAQTTPIVRLEGSFGSVDLFESAQQKSAMLYDGKGAPPAEAWIPWHMIGSMAETSPTNYLSIDAFRTQMKVTGVTLVEDPTHPESWLRDAVIESWDAKQEVWKPIQPLLSNSAWHTHMFAQPVEAARFRLKLPWGVCGNVRLAQIVFHGESLGCSHPDVVAKNPVAVLFDEQEDFKSELSGPVTFPLHDAFHGGRCLAINPPPGGDAGAGPPFRPPFGEAIRNWDFEIAETPAPGQYRYAQFAWKALSPDTKGITLRLSPSNFGGYSFTAGAPTALEGATVVPQSDTPPKDWQVVRVDLWKLMKKPWRVRTLNLGCKGGGAAFDQILLGRTEADLPAR